FLRWSDGGNPLDWEKYMTAIFANPSPGAQELAIALQRLGVEILDFASWPGFQDTDFADRDEVQRQLRGLLNRDETAGTDSGVQEELDRKTKPEAEAWIIIQRERS